MLRQKNGLQVKESVQGEVCSEDVQQADHLRDRNTLSACSGFKTIWNVRTGRHRGLRGLTFSCFMCLRSLSSL